MNIPPPALAESQVSRRLSAGLVNPPFFGQDQTEESAGFPGMGKPVSQPQAEYPFDRSGTHILEKKPFFLKKRLKIHSSPRGTGKQVKAGRKIAKTLAAGKEAEVQAQKENQSQGKGQEPGPG
jgi:hypothetical protein